MGLVNSQSLAGTLGNINLARLKGEKLSAADRNEAAAWIASRAGAEGSYRGLPAPTGHDRHHKLRLFTGETVGSHAGTGCKLGFEAAWALAVLKPTAAEVRRAAETCLGIAVERFTQESPRRKGTYCCYSCSNAGWRALGVAPSSQAEELLGAGLSLLRGHREGNGRWAKFPFWYTVLALSDLDRPDALDELRHAAPALARSLRSKADDAFARRRKLLASAILARV